MNLKAQERGVLSAESYVQSATISASTICLQSTRGCEVHHEQLDHMFSLKGVQHPLVNERYPIAGHPTTPRDAEHARRPRSCCAFKKACVSVINTTSISTSVGSFTLLLLYGTATSTL